MTRSGQYKTRYKTRENRQKLDEITFALFKLDWIRQRRMPLSENDRLSLLNLTITVFKHTEALRLDADDEMLDAKKLMENDYGLIITTHSVTCVYCGQELIENDELKYVNCGNDRCNTIRWLKGQYVPSENRKVIYGQHD